MKNNKISSAPFPKGSLIFLNFIRLGRSGAKN